MEEKNTEQISNQVDELNTLQKFIEEKADTDFFFDTRSKEIDKITIALIKFIHECPQMKTDKTTGRYNYQTFPGMLKAITPIMSKHGLKLEQNPHTVIGRTYMITIISHISGQYKRAVCALPTTIKAAGKTENTEENMQAFGSAQTYVKRYALKAMLGLDADDDTDGN